MLDEDPRSKDDAAEVLEHLARLTGKPALLHDARGKIQSVHQPTRECFSDRELRAAVVARAVGAREAHAGRPRGDVDVVFRRGARRLRAPSRQRKANAAEEQPPARHAANAFSVHVQPSDDLGQPTLAQAIGQRRATMRADALVRSVQSLVATTERSGDVGGSWRVRIGLQRPAMKGGNVGQTDGRH